MKKEEVYNNNGQRFLINNYIPDIQISPSWFSQDNLIKLFKFTSSNDTREKDNLNKQINEKQEKIKKLVPSNNQENKELLNLNRKIYNLQKQLLKLPSKTIIKDINKNIIKNVDDLAISIYENFNIIYDIDYKENRYIFKKKP